MFGDSANRSPMLARILNDDPRHKLALGIAEGGMSTAPVKSKGEGLARILQAALGAASLYKTTGDAQNRQADYNSTIAQALKAGQGWQNPDHDPAVGANAAAQYQDQNTLAAMGQPVEQRRYLQPGERVMGGPGAMAQVLAGNKDTAGMGLQLSVQDMQNRQKLEQQYELKGYEAGLDRAKTAEQRAFEASPEYIELQRRLAEAKRDPNAGTPADVREYEYAKQQGYPGSFEDWQLAQRRASAAQTNVNLPPQQKKEDEAFGASLVKYYDTVTETAAKASETIQQVQMLQSIPLTDTGAGTNLKARLTALGEAMGIAIPPDMLSRVADVQSYRAIGGTMLAARLQAQPGTQTEGDADRMRETLASTENLPEANDFINRSILATEGRKIEQANFWDNYRQQQNPPTFNGARAAWEKYKRETPLIGFVTDKSDKKRPVFLEEFVANTARANPGASREEILDLWRQKYGRTR